MGNATAWPDVPGQRPAWPGVPLEPRLATARTLSITTFSIVICPLLTRPCRVTCITAAERMPSRLLISMLLCGLGNITAWPDVASRFLGVWTTPRLGRTFPGNATAWPGVPLQPTLATAWTLSITTFNIVIRPKNQLIRAPLKIRQNEHLSKWSPEARCGANN